VDGKLVALEGVDGCGKSTQAALLAKCLGARLTFEPGATALGRLVRGVLLGHDTLDLDPWAESLLVAADRAQHVAEMVRPWLEAGEIVVCDRFTASTIAYQGYGRGLDLDDLRRLVELAAGGLRPDANVLVDVPVELARKRLGPDEDRLEMLGPDFQQKVVDGYRAEASTMPEEWIVVDGSMSVEEVASEVQQAVVSRLGLEPR
jgi:dTMP kinase